MFWDSAKNFGSQVPEVLAILAQGIHPTGKCGNWKEWGETGTRSVCFFGVLVGYVKVCENLSESLQENNIYNWPNAGPATLASHKRTLFHSWSRVVEVAGDSAMIKFGPPSAITTHHVATTTQGSRNIGNFPFES